MNKEATLLKALQYIADLEPKELVMPWDEEKDWSAMEQSGCNYDDAHNSGMDLGYRIGQRHASSFAQSILKELNNDGA